MPALTGWHFLLGTIVLLIKPAGWSTFFKIRRHSQKARKTKINENEKGDISAVIACYKKMVEMALTAVRFGVG
ncbi:hypothetical protein HED55_03465 [Ochrobactrum haematophilum]|uniref:Uncharacterized protein n=1 Tax=Brucella haematophila TaxID=419474 RepID=A0ABX1DK10_9HYPH|nr:hypothetical protein [Brucella haematophila]